ncbi:MAG: family 78 glycoside hydrolase catalytic domain [Verrucomicrobiales bacterium]|nr:family 78 glycoside hydrolase catalytic domain [Verrucomicrobiales bacterium]
MLNRCLMPGSWALLVAGLLIGPWPVSLSAEGLSPVALRTEWLQNPLGIDSPSPRLSWKLESSLRAQRQTGYRVLVASSKQALEANSGDLWDTGKVASDETIGRAYEGKPLGSGQLCFWKVKVWDQAGQESEWSETASWSMGLLDPRDWKAVWISVRDKTPLHRDRDQLHLPPARHYRKEFGLPKAVRRATIYASSLGLHELYLNGRRVGDALLEPGWSDYAKRVYYRTHDVTGLVRAGTNAIGGIVADGWYAGYVGYGLLVGYGPYRTGRSIYGKTPALCAQLEVEFEDGTRSWVGTDATWKVTDQGPIREADLIMGETFDSRAELTGWAEAGFDDRQWAPCIRAEGNGSVRAIFSDTMGDREVDLGFRAPPVLQSYPAPAIRVTQELPAIQLMKPNPGVYIFDFGQNFAGVARLKLRGVRGTKVQIRYGELLHPDGRLMTENLRKARATDYYILKGDPAGEVWTPRFTYHGFQYVEISGVPVRPELQDAVGLVMHNDTPLAATFSCSDPVLSKFWTNALWTQRANFVEVPTDCPQRDERLGWMGDAQIYARTASFNADVAAFFTKWLDDVAEAQRSFGAYPDYAPYPMSHGEPRKSFGTAWMDAGIICPWTMWKVYGDKRLVDRQWKSMSRFMEFRMAASSKHLGLSIGNTWGDWLNLGEETPIEFIDTCYAAHTSALMAELAEATGRDVEASNYRRWFGEVRAAFLKHYGLPRGGLKVDTQTAYVLALAFELLPEDQRKAAADRLAEKIAKNGHRMATGFLGTKWLLPVLTAHGHHDLALRLFQSRDFPSWGYEVINGATTVWERWDSYTKEEGFGRHNAAMNSFSHYSFGAVCEWAFRSLAGIDTDGPAYKQIVIRPGPGKGDLDPQAKSAPIDRVDATYNSIRGPIRSSWHRDGSVFSLNLTVPANATATVYFPARDEASISEGGHPVDQSEGVRVLRREGDRVVMTVGSGEYQFQSR